MKPNRPLRDAFAYFRKAWGPRAAYHLARMRFGTDWRDRLVSMFWLMAERVPASGAASSMNFQGAPYAREPATERTALMNAKVDLTLTVVATGQTEKDRRLEIGDTVRYLGHVPGGMVKIRHADGTEDVAHPACFGELR